MESKKFENVAICETNDKYEKCIIRNDDIYKRSNDIRSELIEIIIGYFTLMLIGD